MQKHVVVIGGGAAGAAAAYQLQKSGFRVTILESRARLGGRLHSQSWEGVSFELGGSFIAKKLYPMTFDLVGQLGLSADLRPRHSRLGLCLDGRELSVRSLLTAPGLAWASKLRYIGKLGRLLAASSTIGTYDADWPTHIGAYDKQSVADFFSGQSQPGMRSFIEPILNGYCYWSAERTSAGALLALLKGAGGSGTFTLAGGLQQLPEQLAANCTIRLNCDVKWVTKKHQKYQISFVEDGRQQLLSNIDGLVCATTADAALDIISNLSRAQKEFLSAVHYSSTAVVARVYRRDRPRPSYGLGFPVADDIYTAAITSASEPTMPGQAVEIVRTYGSGRHGQLLVSSNDTTLKKKLAAPKLLNQQTGYSHPTHTVIQRWPQALPEFVPGHFRRLQQFNNGDIEDPAKRLVFAGDYLAGPYIEGAITSGIRAAKRLQAQLS